MGSLRGTLCALRGTLCAGAVLAAVCTPSAYAADPDVGVTPSAASAPAGRPATPVAPVRAGGGGAAHLGQQRQPTGTSYETPDARTEGPGTPHAVVGLVLAGAAALAVVLSGGRRGRRTG